MDSNAAYRTTSTVASPNSVKGDKVEKEGFPL